MLAAALALTAWRAWPFARAIAAAPAASRSGDVSRRVAGGFEAVGLPRCRENSFCCGAGGGRIGTGDEGVVERPSENRIKEALALEGVSKFVVACPKDKVMYSAATDALGVKERLHVLDVVELIHST